MLSRLFRRLFLRELENAFAAGKLRFFSNLASLVERKPSHVVSATHASTGWSTPSHRSAARIHPVGRLAELPGL